jgi:hypothetical protein
LSQSSEGSNVNPAEDPVAKMAELMAQRNAMARARIIGQDVLEIPPSLFKRTKSPASAQANTTELLTIVL